MHMKGRTVVFFVTCILLAMFASSILTLTIAGPLSFANSANGASAIRAAGLDEKDWGKLATTYELIRTQYLNDVDKDKVITGAINGMLTALDDPFSVYMDTKEAEMFDEALESSFQGIGAEVSLEDGRVTIVSPIKGSPAERAGIIAGDVILSVNGEKLDGLKLNEAVMKIRGPKGTQAKLEILRSGSLEPTQIIVVRDEIPIETVYSEMLENQIGKIEVRQFAMHTAKDFKAAIKELEAKGMKGLIIDVRNDPGGLLPAVVEMSEQFVPNGKPVVQIEDRNGQKSPTLSKGSSKPYPVAVLINNGSASASEILAGALSEEAGAKLIGKTTYGKGTVQVTFQKEMGDGSNLKMTVYKWLTPKGNWIHKTGIKPDIEVDQPSFFMAVPLTKKSTLKLDTTSEDVKNLQLMLTAIGLKPGREDGYFNTETEAAVREFQRQASLPVNGEVDEKTAQKLEETVYREIREPKHDLQLKEAVKYMNSVIK
jgi:carboxyl-terminal processing protease